MSRDYKIRVVSRKWSEDGVYVARPTPLGNPFKTGRFESTKPGQKYEHRGLGDVLHLYREWLIERLRTENSTSEMFVDLLHRYEKEGQLSLACWCVPKGTLPGRGRCHASIIREFIIRYYEPIDGFLVVYNDEYECPDSEEPEGIMLQDHDEARLQGLNILERIKQRKRERAK